MRNRGFTLLEVSIAIAILAVFLVALLNAQANSLHQASRARTMTIATLLARSKMIDIEQLLFDEGFVMGEQTDDGDFDEEGHKEYKWKYRVSELELDLSALSSLCGGFSEDTEGSGAACEGMLSGFAGPFESLTDELGRSLRLVDLEVSWPSGKSTESMSLKAMVTREDFSLAPMLPDGVEFPRTP